MEAAPAGEREDRFLDLAPSVSAQSCLALICIGHQHHFALSFAIAQIFQGLFPFLQRESDIERGI